MNLRKSRTLLNGVGALASIAALVVAAYAVSAPYAGTDAGRGTEPGSSRPATQKAQPRTKTPERSLAAIEDLSLRRPLVDQPVRPKSEAKASAPAPAFNLGLTLKGTILEPGRPLAVVVTPDGKIAIYEVGQSIEGGGTIDRITADEVAIRYGGSSTPTVLKVPKPVGRASGL